MNHVSRTFASLAIVLLLALGIVFGASVVRRSTSHAASPAAANNGQTVRTSRPPADNSSASMLALGYIYSAAPIFTPPAPEHSAAASVREGGHSITGYIYSAAPIFTPPAPEYSAAAPVREGTDRAASASSSRSDTIFEWNSKARHAAIEVAQQPATQSMIYISFVQAAVYDAVVAIRGGYEPYKLSLDRQPGASMDAAVATAAHDVLVHYFPGQKAELDAGYADTLARIPGSESKQAGIAVGREAAAGIVALRQGDGLEADINFVMPPPAPGTWQLPASQAPQTPWVSKLRPFMLERPDQFRPRPPPALGSAEYAAEFNEVKTMGAANSAQRTAEQTDVAKFWSTNSVVQYNTAFKQVAQARKLGPVQTARLFAMGNMIGADALIACFDAKYHYLFWRPIFAIPGAENDGNPDTASDAAWKPLLATPNHPEYPGGHGCLTAAEAEVFASFLGNDEMGLELASNTPGLLHPVRRYNKPADLVEEIVNARVWGGLHYRGSARTGAALGNNVARWVLGRYFLPTGPSQADGR